MPAERRPATVLLQAWRGGDRDALDRLLPVVYDELSGLARHALRGERTDHTLQTRALVHEAYIRLVDADIPFQDRAHFLAVAARTMRRILVDHARARRRDKRGGGAGRVDLDQVVHRQHFEYAQEIDLIGRIYAQDHGREREMPRVLGRILLP